MGISLDTTDARASAPLGVLDARLEAADATLRDDLPDMWSADATVRVVF